MEKMDVTIDFYGNLSHLCGDCSLLADIRFTDILKYCVLQKNFAKFMTCLSVIEN